MISKAYLDSVEYDLSQSAIPSELMDQYELGQLLFESNHSQIFRLIRRSDHLLCTLKAISKSSSLTFDFKSIQNLKHERLPRVYFVGESSRFVYVIKEYIPGVTLEKYLQNNAPLSEDEIYGLCMQLLDVVEYFHHPDRNIVYRDIKPENIIIDESGSLHLIDLETIRIVKKESNSDTVSIATRGFASPEQYGYCQTDQRSDIYSIGATLYYIFKRVPPSPYNTDYEGIPSKWRPMISKCLKFNPNHRFKDTLQLKKEIQNIKRPYVKKLRKVMSSSVFLVLLSFLGLFLKGYTFPKNTTEALLPQTETVTEIQTTETQNPVIISTVFPDDLMDYSTYLKLYEVIPESIMDESYEFVVSLSGSDVEGTHSVYMFQRDYYGHSNQTGSDAMAFISGHTFGTFSSPVKSLHYVEGQYYEFTIYVDDNKNKMFDVGERYSVINYRKHDGNLIQSLTFDQWQRNE